MQIMQAGLAAAGGDMNQYVLNLHASAAHTPQA